VHLPQTSGLTSTRQLTVQHTRVRVHEQAAAFCCVREPGRQGPKTHPCQACPMPTLPTLQARPGTRSQVCVSPCCVLTLVYAFSVRKPATTAQAFWISSRFNGTISFSMPMQNSLGVTLSFPSKSMTETGREKSTSAHLFTSKCRHTHSKKLTYKRVDHAVEACPEPVLNCRQCPLPPIDAPSHPCTPMHTLARQALLYLLRKLVNKL
jgi:hypothetical protein